MKVGLYLGTQFTAEADVRASLAEAVEQVKVARDSGFARRGAGAGAPGTRSLRPEGFREPFSAAAVRWHASTRGAHAHLSV